MSNILKLQGLETEKDSDIFTNGNSTRSVDCGNSSVSFSCP